MSDLYPNGLDIDILYSRITGWVPFSVRYGFRKISKFVAPNPNYPKPDGILWSPPQEGNNHATQP